MRFCADQRWLSVTGRLLVGKGGQAQEQMKGGFRDCMKQSHSRYCLERPWPPLVSESGLEDDLERSDRIVVGPNVACTLECLRKEAWVHKTG